jgi:pseudouridine synthase
VSSERLQKILARAGVASRRGAEELIREGRVTVNGQIATLGEKVDPETDAIKLDGRRVQPLRRFTYILLNKPRGYVSTRRDPQGRPTVFDLVPRRFRRSLVTAGRLDFDSEGLLVLTDDGQFAHQLTHPSYGCIKTYRVKVKGVPSEAGLKKLRRGIVINGRRTAPVKISPHKQPHRLRGEGNSWWLVELGEGRNRQIREMFFRIGCPVLRLVRVAIGEIADPEMPLGACRVLNRHEVSKLRRQKSRARK